MQREDSVALFLLKFAFMYICRYISNKIICSMGVNIKKIASNKVVETIVRNVTGRMNTNEKDLCQDIYLQLIADKNGLEIRLNPADLEHARRFAQEMLARGAGESGD